jgi:large subunit ribosomal protein L3
MLIGRKLGMTRVFSESGESVPVTVIKASPCFIIDRRTEERDGYTAYVMGFGEKKEKRVKRPVLGLCKKAGVPPVEVIREFRVKDTSSFEIGEKIPVSVLQEGDRIDVVGWSKGKGFQGVVKRWGFAGGPGSHGSRFGRAPGSAGAGTYPGRVLKGKKFPGRMGNDRVTVKNLEVVTLDEEKGLIVVKGAVPGFRNGFLLIKIKGDVDFTARKEMAKERAEKKEKKVEVTTEEAAAEEKVEEKVEATAEEKVEKKAEEKEKSKADKKEKKAKAKEGKAEAKVEEAKEEVEKKAEEKAKTTTDKEEKKEIEVKDTAEKAEAKEEKTESTAGEAVKEEKVEEKAEETAEEAKKDEKAEENKEEVEAKTEKKKEEKAEAKKEEKAEEKSEEKKEKVKNEGAGEEKAEKKDQSKEKGDS